jgi:hypothetical protein
MPHPQHLIKSLPLLNRPRPLPHPRPRPLGLFHRHARILTLIAIVTAQKLLHVDIPIDQALNVANVVRPIVLCQRIVLVVIVLVNRYVCGRGRGRGSLLVFASLCQPSGELPTSACGVEVERGGDGDAVGCGSGGVGPGLLVCGVCLRKKRKY